jgi:hypothetical protein
MVLAQLADKVPAGSQIMSPANQKRRRRTLLRSIFNMPRIAQTKLLLRDHVMAKTATIIAQFRNLFPTPARIP